MPLDTATARSGTPFSTMVRTASGVGAVITSQWRNTLAMSHQETLR